MGDFYQSEMITTLHAFPGQDLERIEGELEEYVKARPIALVLPSLYSELKGEALKRIVKELCNVRYINEIVVSLGRAGRDEFKRAKEFFSVLPQEVRIIWNDGERMQELYRLLEKNDIRVGKDGKGRAAWIAFGYVLANEKSSVIAIHDCDILTYTRLMLARLCYPIVNPNMGYEFCKGYYTRVTDRMYGRVTRLFVTPLIRALKKVFGPLPFLLYLNDFRYILAGEFSMISDLARVNRIPGDWGLEVGVLAEVFRNCTSRRICQVDLYENYEHKHQELSPEDPQKGLMKMCIDIAKSIFRTLASDGIVFEEGTFRTIEATYLKMARDTMKMYNDDAAINGIYYDLHQEGLSIEAFTKGIRMASQEFLIDPFGVPLIPNWNRVTSAIPNFLKLLKEAVERDFSEV